MLEVTDECTASIREGQRESPDVLREGLNTDREGPGVKNDVPIGKKRHRCKPYRAIAGSARSCGGGGLSRGIRLQGSSTTRVRYRLESMSTR